VKALGVLALAFYAAHAGWHVSHHLAWDLFWVCNVSMPLLVLGCILEQSRLAASAVMILAYGTPLWTLDLLTGGQLVITSPLIHVGGLVIGGFAVGRLGWPRGTWAIASLLTAALLLFSRLVTPPDANVNLAFRVHEGWESLFPSHILYVVLMWTGSAVVFALVELGARRLLVRSSAASPRALAQQPDPS
jgi:hypothetical protein